MKEVRISPASHLEIHIHMSGQMEEDLKKCMKLAAQIGDGPDCNECSWRDLVIGNGSQEVAMCTLPEVREEIGDEERMKRFTWKAADGRWGVENIPWKEINKRLYGALCKLKDYEDTGLSPDEVARLVEEYGKAGRQL